MAARRAARPGGHQRARRGRAQAPRRAARRREEGALRVAGARRRRRGARPLPQRGAGPPRRGGGGAIEPAPRRAPGGVVRVEPPAGAAARRRPICWSAARAVVKQTIDQPGNVGWRARGELVEWWSLDGFREETEHEVGSVARAPTPTPRPAPSRRRPSSTAASRRRASPGPSGTCPRPTTASTTRPSGPGPGPPSSRAIRSAWRRRASTPPNAWAARCGPRAPRRASTTWRPSSTCPPIARRSIAVQGAFAIFVDDVEVLTRDTKVWGIWPRFAARVRLEAGRHRILARVAGAETSIRLQAPTGAPLGLIGSDDPAPPYTLTPPEILADPNALAPFLAAVGVPPQRGVPRPPSSFDPADPIAAHARGLHGPRRGPGRSRRRAPRAAGQGSRLAPPRRPLRSALARSRDRPRAGAGRQPRGEGSHLPAGPGARLRQGGRASAPRRRIRSCGRPASGCSSTRPTRPACPRWPPSWRRSPTTSARCRTSSAASPPSTRASAGSPSTTRPSSSRPSASPTTWTRSTTCSGSTTRTARRRAPTASPRASASSIRRPRSTSSAPSSGATSARPSGSSGGSASCARTGATSPCASADLLTRAGASQESLAKLEAAVQKKPLDPEARLALADARLARGDRSALGRALVDAIHAGAETGHPARGHRSRRGDDRAHALPHRRAQGDRRVRGAEAGHARHRGARARLLGHLDPRRRLGADAGARDPLHPGARGHHGAGRAAAARAAAQDPHPQARRPRARARDRPRQGDDHHAAPGDRRLHRDRDHHHAARRRPGRPALRGAALVLPRGEDPLLPQRVHHHLPKNRPLDIETGGTVPRPEVSESGALVHAPLARRQEPGAARGDGERPHPGVLAQRAHRLGHQPRGHGRAHGRRRVRRDPARPAPGARGRGDHPRRDGASRRAAPPAEDGPDAGAPPAAAPRSPPLAEKAPAEGGGARRTSIEEKARRIYRWVLASVEAGRETDGRRVVMGRSGNRTEAFLYLCRLAGIDARDGPGARSAGGAAHRADERGRDLRGDRRAPRRRQGVALDGGARQVRALRVHAELAARAARDRAPAAARRARPPPPAAPRTA